MATAEEWRGIAVASIERLLRTELAVTQPEMEAKLSERKAGPPDGRLRPQPHHLTSARQRLLQAGVLEQVKESTRGRDRTITTYSLAPGSKRAQRAAARKRLLQARYLSWGQQSSEWGEAAPIPAALERVIHASLVQAAPHGYHLLRPDGGEVDRIFGAKVPGGPLDNAAHYTGVGSDGMPLTPVTMPIEAKNLRQWVYPQTQELYQLLDKSAQLQHDRRAARLMPVLVCRQMHRAQRDPAPGQLGIRVRSFMARPPEVWSDQAGKRPLRTLLRPSSCCLGATRVFDRRNALVAPRAHNRTTCPVLLEA